jgi:hypothetical protein
VLTTDRLPWNYYINAYDFELSGSVTVMYKISVIDELFIIRNFSARDAERKLYLFR